MTPKTTGHHSNAEDVQSFDDRALGEDPPRIGNPLAGHPARYTNPKSVGNPPGLIKADGTASPRETPKTLGPTKYNTPPIQGNTGSIRNKGKYTPSKVDTYGDGIERLPGISTPSGKGIGKLPNKDSSD